MSKGSLLCLLVLLQVCIAQLSPISSSQLTRGHIGDNLLCQDPIWRARLMSNHGRDEFDGHSTDSIFHERVDTGDEYETKDRGMPVVAGGEAGAEEEEEGLLLLDGDNDGGGSGRTKDSSSGSGGDVECPECGKFFKNDKSMFGHLRSHPNRGYKGATPPVKKLKLSPDTTSAAAPTSSSPSAMDRPPAQHSGRDPRLTPLEILCAYVIFSMRFRDSNQQAIQQVLPLPPPQPSFGKLDAIGQTEGGIGTGGTVTDNAAAEFKCSAGAEACNLGSWDEHGDSIVKIPKKRRNMPKEVREARKKKAKLVNTPKEKRPYPRKHCKAEFPTNQSLGGHVAGHHREKKVARLYDPSGMAAGNDLPLPGGMLSEKLSMALDVQWQSGQASGGQMRQHSDRRNDSKSPAVAVAPASSPTNDRDARRLWNIDLNVEAPEQE